MSLKDIVNLPLTIATPETNPYEVAIIPLLEKSKLYERGVAFFHSEWIDLAKDGLLKFIKNGGKMKLLTSIKVDEDEFNAIKNGFEAKTNEILKKQLFDSVYESTQKSGKYWTLQFMSWMICENILELKISVHKSNINNIYHDKVCFFSDDENNEVCIHGTLNDSLNATSNQELLLVCKSWNDEHKKFMTEIRDTLNRSWGNKVETFVTLDLPEIVKLEFNKIQDSFNPYSKIITSLSGKVSTHEPRDYQNIAIANLRDNDYCGLLSMATGTGKTLTSLFAAKDYIKNYGKSTICIVVPQITLIEQWEENIKKVFPESQILVCAHNKNNWYSKLQIISLTASSMKDNIFLICTYDTLTNSYFSSKTRNFKKNFIYIFDECHSLGSNQLRTSFKPLLIAKKIGLSATPDRWFDENGTSFVKETIGPVVYEYTMEEAIEKKKLCKYVYNIVLSPLNDNEMNKFISLSKEISKQAQVDKTMGNDFSQKMESLTMERARISKQCSSKWELFFNIFKDYQNKKGSLVYVFDKQVDDMVIELKKRFGITCYGIVAGTSADDRKKILNGFNNGTIDVLVAIKCLDEGVDIPNCHTEFILASSTNPREFIQRRGRVLRTSLMNAEKVATIYDFVTTAPSSNFYNSEDKLSVIVRELPRVAEFVRLSKNKEDIELIKYLTSLNGLANYQTQNPWGVCVDNKLNDEGE